MQGPISLNLNVYSDLEVRVKDEWIPFSIFREGKHKEELDRWFEELSCNTIDSDHIKLLVLSENLGADIRHSDNVSGIIYQVHFQKDRTTKLCSYVKGREIYGQSARIRCMCEGQLISEDFESSLSHILDI